MKIYAVSDLHGNLDRLDPSGADVVIIAGDVAPISGRWAFETSDEADLARHFEWIPDGVDILVTHSPPFVEGWNIDVSLQTQSPHFGSRALADAIRRIKPKLFFCGHIHTGDHRVHDLVHEDGSITKLYNVSRLNEDYCIEYEPLTECVCLKKDVVELTIELEDDLAQKAVTMFNSLGITLEQGLCMFVEEFVRYQGCVKESISSTLDRFDRIQSFCTL